ncbi:TetR/AcrR family transcriptional regulator [Siminovitchia terrae]|uniref:TetR/AcrR family transcriptional regulator n=1 Tax=Siminovitchia terrae TaxID=1914933 RepID=A0A429X5H2_SIMTE|nr:TetR/AcrR family transcriptional regulator [Siminovitchia terrae]RST58624.1 TetR/AcrR family transcriptional regulator [Siminovitchia terrae]
MSKKEKIIEVAKQLFRTKGYHDTAIQDILEHSKVSKGTFYNYFSTKSQLILHIIQKVDAKVEEQQNLLLLEGMPNDKQIFYSQLRVKHSIYGTEKIAELYNISLGENDEELQKYMAKSHYKELDWLATRLIEVYGNEIEDSAMDLSTHFIGGLGYQFRYSDQMKLDLNSSDILDYNIIRLEKNIETTKQSNQVLFPYKSPSSVESQEIAISKIQKLLTINDDEFSQEEQEIINFILEEIQNSYVRWGVCEGAIRQLKILSSSITRNKQLFNEIFNIIHKQTKK